MALLVQVNYQAKGSYSFYLGIYGSLMVTYLLVKMGLSFRYEPYTNDPPELKVSVVVPFYNEKPGTILELMDSLMKQDYPIHEIFFIDDGSGNNAAHKELARYAENAATAYKLPKTTIHRLANNQGKRHAQAWAFRRATGNAIVTIDSDTKLFSDSIRELMRPLADPQVTAVTGHLNALNRDDNYLTRLIDMRYENAFRVERAAQTVTGNILVCSGPLSVYRANVIKDNLDDYTSQRFLGRNVQFGDDRRLTNYAIKSGKTVYQSTAKGLTEVPNRLSKFLRQQLRWNKSFYRESLCAFRGNWGKWNVLVWVALEMSLWLLFGFSFIFTLVIKSIIFGWIILIYYLAYIALAAYVRNIFYLIKHPFAFLLAPVYGLLHITALFPLRLYALFTLRSNEWGTR